MHQALYRKWRPSGFDEVCGQEHITKVLKYETEHGLFSHAYLFCGSRGTGKTTCAKILSRAVNCEHPINGSPCGECAACRAIESGASTDVLELDAASNNGVDNIRAILDEVEYTPSSMKYRVYIIDEVHMLSQGAFNALLKTLEEPPEYVIFILATTELRKLPATIISRCQRYDFRRIAVKTIVERLNHIAAEEGIRLTEDAALTIARLAQGGMRDAISMLDLCAGGNAGEITADTVNERAGAIGRESTSETVRAVADRSYGRVFSIINDIDTSARDITVFFIELISYYRDMMLFKSINDASKYLDLTDAETKLLSADSARFTREQLLYHSSLLDEAYASMQRSPGTRRTTAELTLLRMCDPKLDTGVEALLARISELEDRIAMGDIPRASEKRDEPLTDKAPEKVKAPVESKPTAASEQKLAETAEKPKDQGLRPWRKWAEAVEKFSAKDIMGGKMLKQCRGYLDGDRVIIFAENKSPENFLLRGAVEEKLYAALSAVLGRKLTRQDVKFEIKGAGGEYDAARAVCDELDALADGDE